MSDKLMIIPLRDAHASETDWLERLLAPLPHEILEWSENSPIQPGALYLFNSLNEMDLSPEFLSGVRQAGGCGLIHLGDEYLRGDVKAYAAFDYVVRMFPFGSIRHKGIHGIPLGYTNNLGPACAIKASQREHLWMFAGDWKADRGIMADAFRHVPNGFLDLPRSYYGEKGVSRAEYIGAMANAVFAPSPAGNICVETCRPYEALHLGAIPILPQRRFVDPFRDLFGQHPLPSFKKWGEAVEFVRAMSSDPAGLDSLQNECLTWWAAEQERLSEDLAAFIRASTDVSCQPALAERFGARGLSPVSRAMSLIVQQNRRQIVVRSRFAARRMLDKALGRGRGTGDWSYKPDAEPKAAPVLKSDNDSLPTGI